MQGDVGCDPTPSDATRPCQKGTPGCKGTAVDGETEAGDAEEAGDAGITENDTAGSGSPDDVGSPDDADSSDDVGSPDDVGSEGGGCGDGEVAPDETCDDGTNDGSYGGCMPGCEGRAAHCGDANVDDEEVCDDGLNVGGAGGCSTDCLANTNGCGTPFASWPAICREDLPDVMSDFTEPTLPTFMGNEIEARVHLDLAGLAAGSIVHIPEDYAQYLFVGVGSDLDFVIEEGVQVDALIVDKCTRCRVRGGGPNARIKYLNITQSHDVTIDSVLIKSDMAFNPLAVEIHDSSRIALVSMVFHSPYSAAMFANNVQHLLIAGCNWGSSDANGVNDWGTRLANTSNIVIVDSQVETLGMQPVIRRGGGTSGSHFYLRTTTVSLRTPESTLDLGGETPDVFDQLYQREPTYYISNLSARHEVLRYGTGAGDDASMGSYQVTDATWYTPQRGESAFLDDAALAARETAAFQYRLGTPVFHNTLTGSYEERHPGWPTRASLSLGVPLSVANPYDL